MKKIISLMITSILLGGLLLTSCDTKTSPAETTKEEASTAKAADTTKAAAVAEKESEQTSEEKKDDAEPISIRAAWWGDTKRNDLYSSIIDEFEKEFTHVTVVREPLSWGDYWDKLSIQAAGGNAPDFMGMHSTFAADYIPRGICAPLDEYLADGTIRTDGWAEGTLKTGVYNNITYMIPMGVTFSGYFVNVGLFNELGIEVPDFDWTWDDLETIGQAVREAADAKGMSRTWIAPDNTSNFGYWRFFVRQRGRELFDNDGNITFTMEDVRDWFDMYKNLRDANLVPDAETVTEFAGATLEDSMFSRDMTLTQNVPVNQFKVYSDTFPDKELAIIRIPVAPGLKVGEFPEGAHFAVNAKSSDGAKLAAAQLMDFWVNEESALKLFGLDQGVPGNLTVVESIIPQLDDSQLKIVEFVDEMSKIATPTIWSPTGASEFEDLFRSLGESVMFGMTDTEQAAQEFYDQSVEIALKNKN